MSNQDKIEQLKNTLRKCLIKCEYPQCDDIATWNISAWDINVFLCDKHKHSHYCDKYLDKQDFYQMIHQVKAKKLIEREL